MDCEEKSWRGAMNDKVSNSPQVKPLQEEIARKAYFLWERSGRPDGCEMHFWLQAEESFGLRYDTDVPAWEKPLEPFEEHCG